MKGLPGIKTYQDPVEIQRDVKKLTAYLDRELPKINHLELDKQLDINSENVVLSSQVPHQYMVELNKVKLNIQNMRHGIRAVFYNDVRSEETCHRIVNRIEKLYDRVNAALAKLHSDNLERNIPAQFNSNCQEIYKYVLSNLRKRHARCSLHTHRVSGGKARQILYSNIRVEGLTDLNGYKHDHYYIVFIDNKQGRNSKQYVWCGTHLIEDPKSLHSISRPNEVLSSVRKYLVKDNILKEKADDRRRSSKN